MVAPIEHDLRIADTQIGLLQGTAFAIAYPILVELADEIERRKLEEWEEAAIVAQPLALLYRCAEKLGRDDAEREKIYQKLCRLDPGQALALR